MTKCTNKDSSRKMIHMTIDQQQVAIPEGTTILAAAKQAHIDIPNLCTLEGLHPLGGCRLCLVEVEGEQELQASCSVQAKEGMVIHTHTENLRTVRKNLFELLLSTHRQDCLECERNLDCELQAMGKRLGVTEARFSGRMLDTKQDASVVIFRDPAKCIQCRRCMIVCSEIQKVGIFNAQNHGFQTVVGTALDLPIATLDCTACGQCTLVCPVAALQETDTTETVYQALKDSRKRVVAQIDPAVAVAIGEELGFERNQPITPQLIAGLRKLGFEQIHNTGFATDVNILETSKEFLARLKESIDTSNQGQLPMLTSECSAWVKHVEQQAPEQVGNLSLVKSPHVQLGRAIKDFDEQQNSQDAGQESKQDKDTFVVSITPCTAKKFEITRPEMITAGEQNVDAVLTTREIAKMIRQSGMDLHHVGQSSFDAPFAGASAAAVRTAASKGVITANLATIYQIVTGRELSLEKLDFRPVNKSEQLEDVEILIAKTLPEYQFLEGFTLKVAVASGLGETKSLLQQITLGTSPYHLIEVMACPGGCINGGGQLRSATPIATSQKRLEVLEEMARSVSR